MVDKEFSYNYYGNLIRSIHDEGYSFCDYFSWGSKDKSVILRHDVDYDLDKAVALAKYEQSLVYDYGKLKPTYFVLLTSGFYNLYSYESRKKMDTILETGAEIGLHFDEAAYESGSIDQFKERIYTEAGHLGDIIDKPIRVVSMHRPSAFTLDSNIELDGLVNSYSKEFFKDMKYISDSRRNWREDADDVIKCGEYNRLHILTHSFWYDDINRDLERTLSEFICKSPYDRWNLLNDNFRDLSEVIDKNNIKVEL